ncbi:MAG: enoyl-CoA hydratase/isomerase family protein [Myxococcales bacterium]|nr:enoyl-CoA hydratase/isomerase family protein [Myxococcales bacterium]
MQDDMQYEMIRVETAGAIRTILINRPDRRNALTSRTLEELQQAFGALPKDPEARVIILRGAGDQAFCAGADLHEVHGTDGVLAMRRYFSGVADTIEAIHRCPLPVVALVHGFALAGGCGLAVAPDFTVAADDAVFGLPEVRIGLLPMTVMAPIFRCVGRKQGVRMAMLGERIEAHRALEIGLVTEVVPKARLDARAMDLAERLAALSPATLALAKEGIFTMADMEYFKSLHYLREMIALTASTEDAREGIGAFLEKREPVWKGR